MVNVQRCNLLDSKAPNPSVETLLHAFLPHKFIDHTHSNAVLALTDQPDGEELARDVFGKRAALVPYIMPGFALAKKASEVSRAHPDVEGLILLKHGIFSMGATAEEAYVRMIDLVTLAEKRLAKATRKIFPGVTLPREHRRRPPKSRRSCAVSSRCRQRAAGARRRSASSSSSAPGRRSWPMSPARRSAATASRDR